MSLKLLAAMLLFLCTAVSVRSEELTYKVRIHLKSSATGMGELYYDTGAGFVQGQSVAQTVTASQTLEAIDFDLPAGIRLTGLRLDPLDVPGTFEIGEAEIYSPDGKILRKLASSSFLPEQQLMTLSRNAKTLVVEAPAGSFYPVLRINLGEPLRLPRRPRTGDVVLHWTLTLVALTLLVITVLRRFRSDTFQRIRSWFDVLPLSAVDSIARKISDPHLIVFDRVSLMILGAAAAVFLLCSGLKLHGSSSAFWDFYIAGKKPQTGVLLGEPKLFRMDEWSVFTPNIFSQIYSKPAFSATNQSVGGGTTVLFWSSPVNHFSELPRFHLWAFHFLPVDFAFSVYWNLKGLILFTGTFLLLMLLTDSRPLLSGAGALWIYFSSITQWWFSHCLPEAIGFGSLTLVAGAYLILTRKRGLLWTAAIALIIAALNFALIFYPPFTIPVMWVMVCTGIGVFWERRKLLTGEDPLRLRWLLLSFSLLCILATLGAFYVDTRDTIKLITSTVYPGNRVSTGGDGSVAALISSLIDQIYTEGHFPKFLTNIGEASSFHLVGLIVLPAIFLRRRGGPALSITDFAIVACLAGFLIFFLFGFPETMAKATLMSLTLSTRTKSGLGLAAIFLLVRHFARCASFEGPKKLHWVIAFGLAAVASTAILHFLEASKFDVPKSAVFMLITTNIALVVLAATGLTLPFFLLLFAVLLPHTFLINPVARGFKSITGKALYKEVAKIRREHPDARWAVFGPVPFAAFIKHCGVQVVDGNKFYPVIELNKALDPGNRYIDIRNAYSYVIFVDNRKDRNAVLYERGNPLAYQVTVSAGAEALDRLGVRYCLLTYPPPPEYAPSIMEQLRDGGKQYWILCRDLIPKSSR